AGGGAGSGADPPPAWAGDDLMGGCAAGLVDFAGLRVELGRAKKAPAAEIIGKLYRQFGLEFFAGLRGAFSLAIWDGHTQTMLLAVDRFAIRSLTYYADNAQIIFGSQARSIFAAGRGEKQGNAPPIAAFLDFSVVRAPERA